MHAPSPSGGRPSFGSPSAGGGQRNFSTPNAAPRTFGGGAEHRSAGGTPRTFGGGAKPEAAHAGTERHFGGEEHRAGPAEEHRFGGAAAEHRFGGAAEEHRFGGGSADRRFGDHHDAPMYHGHDFNRIHGDPYRWPRGYSYRRWDVGYRLPRAFWLPEYYVDYAPYGLDVPPPGAQWVRYGPDILLISLATGEILQTVYGGYY
jgi:Ni/Co efflux regulator RcnB